MTPEPTRRRLLLAGAAMLAAPRLVTARDRGAVRLPDFIRPRAAWGALPPAGGMLPHAIERVTLHHTGPPSWYGQPSAPAYLRSIQSFHAGPDRRWPDIAYHLLIDLDGVIWEGRSLAVAGDSATAYDPTGHALIAVLGDYDEQMPNEAQVDAVAAAAAWLSDAYRIHPATLGGHRDFAATACPGSRLTGWLPELRARISPRPA